MLLEHVALCWHTNLTQWAEANTTRWNVHLDLCTLTVQLSGAFVLLVIFWSSRWRVWRAYTCVFLQEFTSGDHGFKFLLPNQRLTQDRCPHTVCATSAMILLLGTFSDWIMNWEFIQDKRNNDSRARDAPPHLSPLERHVAALCWSRLDNTVEAHRCRGHLYKADKY